MNTNHEDRLVDDYLDRLEEAMRSLPGARRREVVEDVCGHLDAALAEAAAESGGEPSEAAVRQVLDRLGDPADIAREAGAAVDVRPPNWVEWAAIPLLLFGAVFYAVGWVVGVVLLWMSPVFRTSDKVIGTFLVPGGLVTSVLVMTLATSVGGSSTTCVEEVNRPMVCTPTGGGHTAGSIVAGIVVFLIFVVGPIYSAFRLSRRIRAASAQAEL